MLAVILLGCKVGLLFFSASRNNFTLLISRMTRPSIVTNGGKSTTTMGVAATEMTTFGSDPVDQEITGYVQDEFPCAWQNCNGSLIAGSRAIVFRGHFFLFDKTLILTWDDDIRKVVSIVDGIEILLNNGTVHTFRNLVSKDRVWILLMTLHNDALLGRHPTATPAHRNSLGSPGGVQSGSRMFKRRNSDPASAVGIRSAEEIPLSPQRYIKAHTRAVVTTILNFYPDLETTILERAAGGVSHSGSDQSDTDGTQWAFKPVRCKHNGVNGKLYAGTKSLVFTGKRYFWESYLVTLPWSNIRHVRPERRNFENATEFNASSATGFTISTKDPPVNAYGSVFVTPQDKVKAKKAHQFTFVNMDTPDKVWQSLISIHNEKLTRPSQRHANRDAKSDKSASQKRGRRKKMVRMNSDPMLMSMMLNFEYDSDDDDDESTSHSVSSATDFVENSNIDHETARDEIFSGDAQPDSPSQSDQWNAALSHSAKQYTDHVIVDNVLTDCTLDSVFELFFADDAKFSLGRFLLSRGDSELQTTKWTPENSQNENVKQQREVTYVHPVNAPLAPPQAAARKAQTITRYGDHGVLVETQTYVEGVPMADCFYVADRISISESSTSTNSVVLSMEFGLVFVKSTMFKGIITKKTTSEFTGFFEAMSTYMARATTGEDLAMSVQNDHAEDEDKNSVLPDGKKSTRKSSGDESASAPFFTADRVLLLLVFVLQCYMMAELRRIKHALNVSPSQHPKGESIN